MDARTFLDNFATIAEAPGGVHRLRGLVLGLALSGRLVEQDPRDKPVESLLEEVRLKRESLPKGHRQPLRVEAESGQIRPSGLPPTWAEIPLGDIAEIIRGITFPASVKHQAAASDLVPCLRTTNVQETVEWDDLIFVPSEFVKDESQFLRAGDLLMSIANSRELVGKVALVDPEPPRAAFGGFLAAIRPLIVAPRFLQFVLRDPRAKARLIDSATQTTNIANISLGRLRPFRCPLPPLSEQERIVAKVDELMRLCDHLEVCGEHRHRASSRFRRSALHTLSQAVNHDELQGAWHRISANWPVFTANPSGIDQIRQTVVQLAIEGRLVPQDQDDEPAAAILQASQERKQGLVDAGETRPRSDVMEVGAHQLPFALPSGWALASLDLWCIIAGGVAKGRKMAGRTVVSLPYLRVANVKAGYLLLDEVKEIEVALDEVDRYSLRAGDVLLTEGGDWDKLGRSAIWTGEIEPCLHQNHVFRARPLDERLMPAWISLYTNSDSGRQYFQSKAKRTTNLASINMTELRSTPLPVPPAAEQRRILEKLAAIQSLLSELETRLRRADAAAALVADALTRVAS